LALILGSASDAASTRNGTDSDRAGTNLQHNIKLFVSIIPTSNTKTHAELWKTALPMAKHADLRVS
jgi:hypothetical protein